MCIFLELYEDFKKFGYDWNDFFNICGWWIFNNDEYFVLMFFMFDLFKMCKGFYFLYWMN